MLPLAVLFLLLPYGKSLDQEGITVMDTFIQGSSTATIAVTSKDRIKLLDDDLNVVRSADLSGKLNGKRCLALKYIPYNAGFILCAVGKSCFFINEKLSIEHTYSLNSTLTEASTVSIAPIGARVFIAYTVPSKGGSKDVSFINRFEINLPSATGACTDQLLDSNADVPLENIHAFSYAGFTYFLRNMHRKNWTEPLTPYHSGVCLRLFLVVKVESGKTLRGRQ